MMMSSSSSNRDLIPQNKKVIIVWSGGLDSTALIAMMMIDYNCDAYPLFINRGQGNYPFEKRAVDHYDNIFTQQFMLKYHRYWEIEVPIPPKAFRNRLPRDYSYILRVSNIINQAVRYALCLGSDIILIGSVPSDKRGGRDDIT